MPMHMLNSFKKFFVEHHVVGMLCQHRLQLLCQCVHIIVGLGTKQIEEYSAHSTKQSVVFVILVFAYQGIVECGLIGVIDDSVKLFVVSPYAFNKRFLIVFESYFVERCGLVWGIIFQEERILTFFLLDFITLHNPVYLLSLISFLYSAKVIK